MKLIHGVEINGVGIDAQTRCVHYKSGLDVIAIKFKCCGGWFPCFECHKECAGHLAKVWSIGEQDTRAILCGVCGHQMTIDEYFKCSFVCPKCESLFNPGCAKHYDLYFEVSPKE